MIKGEVLLVIPIDELTVTDNKQHHCNSIFHLRNDGVKLVF